MRNFDITVNGLPVHAHFSEENIKNIFIPLLKRLTEMQRDTGKRILAFLAAPPGAGKSTLVAFLRELSLHEPDVCPVTVIGMDGFHRRQEELLSRTTVRNGQEVSLVDIKGAPITFDLEKLKDSIRQVAAGENCLWPDYDRLLHNPVYRGDRVEGDIVILEGNYLLLDEDGWRDLKQFADYTIRITADTTFLKNRLVNRKMASGTEPEKAEAFVEFSDLYNARLCLGKSFSADMELCLNANGSYSLIED